MSGKIEFEVVKVLYLKTIELSQNQEPLRFKLEILKSWEVEEYSPRLYRLEDYTLKPSIGDFDRDIPVLIHVLDSCNEWELIVRDSPQAVIEAVLECTPFNWS